MVVNFIPIVGDGKVFTARVQEEGRDTFCLPTNNSFALYSYQLVNE